MSKAPLHRPTNHIPTLSPSLLHITTLSNALIVLSLQLRSLPQLKTLASLFCTPYPFLRGGCGAGLVGSYVFDARYVSRRGGGERGSDFEATAREKHVVVRRGEGDVIWIAGMCLGEEEEEEDDDEGTAGNGRDVLCPDFAGAVRERLSADFGGGLGGGVYFVKEGEGTTRCWVRMEEELCEEFLVWLMDVVEDEGASKPSMKRLPVFRDLRLVKEYMVGLARDVSGGVGGRWWLVRWKRRLKRSIQAWSMESRKRRTKSSMPMSCGH
jgi:hypothetical protein